MEEEKSFEQMKNDSRRYSSEQKATRSVHFAEDKYKSEEEFQTKFNRIFEDNRLGDANDDGYGRMMAASNPLREDINIERNVRSEKELNTSFDDQKALNTDIVKYKEPEALCVQSKRLQYDELGVENVDDFSSDTIGKKLLYSDYMKAHTTNKLVDKSQIKQHKRFKNLEDIKKQRLKQSFELTDDDRRVIEEQEKKQTYLRKTSKAQERIYDSMERAAMQDGVITPEEQAKLDKQMGRLEKASSAYDENTNQLETLRQERAALDGGGGVNVDASSTDNSSSSSSAMITQPPGAVDVNDPALAGA